MPSSSRRRVFGRWSVADVLLGLGAILYAVLALIMLGSVVLAVVEQEAWWWLRALGRLLVTGIMVFGTRKMYRRVGTYPEAR